MVCQKGVNVTNMVSRGAGEYGRAVSDKAAHFVANLLNRVFTRSKAFLLVRLQPKYYTAGSKLWAFVLTIVVAHIFSSMYQSRLFMMWCGSATQIHIAVLSCNQVANSTAAEQKSDSDAFAALNIFITRRLEALVAILSPSATDPTVCSALNALANGATNFKCTAAVRASIAVPLISRYAHALLRCMLGMLQTGNQGELQEKPVEASCGCLRTAFKSLDDALRIVANSPEHQDKVIK